MNRLFWVHGMVGDRSGVAPHSIANGHRYERIKKTHHSTKPYFPSPNGTDERLCKEVLRISETLLPERKLPATQWSSLIEIIQKIINHSPSARLGKDKEGSFLSPMEVLA